MNPPPAADIVFVVVSTLSQGQPPVRVRVFSMTGAGFTAAQRYANEERRRSDVVDVSFWREAVDG